MLASALRGDGAHEGGGVILDFAVHLLVGLYLDWANERDGMSGPGGGSGGHGGDVGGFENEDPGGTGVASRGRHVDDDRYG